jgi:hypothetical protein
MLHHDKYEVVGWPGHWFVLKNNVRVLKNGKRFWYTRKNAADRCVNELKAGIQPH